MCLIVLFQSSVFTMRRVPTLPPSWTAKSTYGVTSDRQAVSMPQAKVKPEQEARLQNELIQQQQQSQQGWRNFQVPYEAQALQRSVTATPAGQYQPIIPQQIDSTRLISTQATAKEIPQGLQAEEKGEKGDKEKSKRSRYEKMRDRAFAAGITSAGFGLYHSGDYIEEMLIDAAIDGDVKKIKLLLPLAKSEYIERALIRAIEANHLEVVKLLLPRIQFVHSWNLSLAVKVGNMEIVKLLLPKAQNQDQDMSLVAAAVEGDIEKLKLLLPKKIPGYSYQSLALEIAAETGNIEIAKLLLPELGWLEEADSAVEIALQKDQIEMVELLFQE